MMPAQIALVSFAFAVLLLSPPRHGFLWLVPVGQAARENVARLAIRQGARLVAAGPGGSVIVTGDRGALWRGMLAAGVMTLAAPPGGCASRPPVGDAA